MSEWDGIERRVDWVSRSEHDTLKEWFKEMNDELKVHTKAEVRMEERIERIEKDLQEIKASVVQVLDIISRAKGAWAFIGWAVGAISAIAAAFAWAREHLK